MGGILTVIRNLQDATRAAGVQHVVWANRAFVEARHPALVYRYSRHAQADSPHHASLLLRSLGAFFELKYLLALEHFDILHAHSRGSLLAGILTAVFLDRAVLFTNHSYAKRIGFYKRAAMPANIYTALLTANMARHYGLAVQPPKVSIVSECCSDRFFSAPLITEVDRRKTTPRLRLVGVGNIVRWKNWHILLQALQHLTEEERARVEFSHWGTALPDRDSRRYERELRAFVRQHGLETRVHLRGTTASVAECLREADWFVLPSTNEPCSVALIEALALGLPALVSSSGGNVDIIQAGKTGLLFQPENSGDLAAMLRKILQSKVELLSPFLIRESVRTRSATAVAQQYVSLYEQLAGDRGAIR